MITLARYVLSISVAVAFLVGCGASQPPIASGAMPQSRRIGTNASRGGSWMLAEAKSEDLLYASRYSAGISVYSYPSGQKVGQLNGIANIRGLCPDADGNVYVTSEPGAVYEYAHGGSKPINTLTDPGSAYGCAVDPRTGDLAVTNYSTQGSDYGDVAVFQNGSGTPTTSFYFAPTTGTATCMPQGYRIAWGTVCFSSRTAAMHCGSSNFPSRSPRIAFNG
jgi:hypothetical protein